MTTYEDALKYLKDKNSYTEHLSSYVGVHWGEVYDIAIEAIEKQIPKKPTYEDVGNIYGAYKRTCPACGDVALISPDARDYEKYCRYCGQMFEEDAE